jgi:NAD-dependent SIR2 family protein deacetylase
MKEKLVLITGAGFSVRAGVPIQSAVLRNVIEFNPRVGELGRKEYSKARESLQLFLNAVFLGGGESSVIRPDDMARLEDITLEDVYTILDKAIGRKDWLPHHAWTDLAQVRQALDLCVCHYVMASQERYGGEDYLTAVRGLYDRFGESWATITLNWDTIWDKALIKVSSDRGKIVDYGCLPLWLSGSDCRLTKYPPETLGVKLLKLHGSFNWVSCPRCRALFVGEADLGKLGHVDSLICPICVPDGLGPLGPSLQSLFLTPTILKTFENPSLNMIWDTALHVLAEATHVVFAGYSFPLADHDLRYLLRKAIPPRARVTVVLHDSDAPNVDLNKKLQGLLPQARYKAFFNLEDDAFFYGGWERYFNEVLTPRAR